MISLMVQTISTFQLFLMVVLKSIQSFFLVSVFVLLATTQVSKESLLEFHLFKCGNLIKVYIYTSVTSHNSRSDFLPSSARQTAVTPPLAS